MKRDKEYYTGTDMEQLFEEFDPFTPKSRQAVTSFCPDVEREFQTGHRSRITAIEPNSDDAATVTQHMKPYP